MTLAAAFCLGQFHFAVADLLLTSDRIDEEGPSDLTLPAMGRVDCLPKEHRTVRGLTQKLCVISDDFVAAFAGDLRKGRIGIRGLHKMAQQGPVTPASLQEFARRGGALLNGVALVGMVVESDTRAFNFEINGERFLCDYVGEVVAAGSGVYLLRLIFDMGRIGPSGFEQLPPGLRALSKVASLCGLLFQDEHATGLPVLEARTGGAYEIACFREGRFVKQEVTFVLWHINVTDGRVDVKEPMLFVKTKYSGHLLLCNVARWTCQPDGSMPIWNLGVYAIPPAFPHAEEEVTETPASIGFASEIVQHTVLVLKDETHVRVFSVVETGGSALNPRMSAAQFEFSHDLGFLQLLQRHVEARMDEPWEDLRQM